jgi:hypothetical protein
MSRTLPILAIILATLTGCEKQPEEAQLNQWYQEAIVEDKSLTDFYTAVSEHQQWMFAIESETDDKVYHFTFTELNRLATTHVSTPEPHPGRAETPSDFRGVRISTLLDMAKIDPNLEKITFVCDDAYRVEVKVADVRKHNIILAIEKNGKNIPRSEGGPLYLVYPHVQSPELKEKYPSTSWGFYITHLILGTESINLKLGKQSLNQEQFEKIPKTILNNSVGYRLYWPEGKIKLQGVKLQDLFKAANLPLQPQTQLILKGKANVTHDPKNPIRLTGKQLEQCTVILASHWGEKLEKIPSKMGGPLTLAFDADCKKNWNQAPYWLTFVEEIEVYP